MSTFLVMTAILLAGGDHDFGIRQDAAVIQPLAPAVALSQFNVDTNFAMRQSARNRVLWERWLIERQQPQTTSQQSSDELRQPIRNVLRRSRDRIQVRRERVRSFFRP